ncbi:MAG: diaminopimelate dehydrogenase [Faecalibacterium sp.]|nr:diaminopimelate dehydrogenase [Ruminococcus sp.]MCM1393070.1 diaminopimelate dehydrogenase [Ruminococcus sp.]MCM1484705.1 diaminopimelate dehydrogenase [Faecalibacterium sp.]
MKIAIAGYGALGAAVEKAVYKSKDIELFGIFTRRNCDIIKTIQNTAIYPFSEIRRYKNDIDVVINSMGSAFDLPETTPSIAADFNQVDSFDTHSEVREHFKRTNAAAISGEKLSLVCAGWDPGLFSIARAYMKAVLPGGMDYTFWGEGVSRGHSNAIKKINGVVDAIQYTVPVKSAVISVRNGDLPSLKPHQMHKRVCYVVAEPGADVGRIEKDIKAIPNYFAEYNTEVNFIDYESFLSEHTKMSHGGNVICCEKDDNGISLMEFSLMLDSNPYFTAQILLCFARAVNKMNSNGKIGCITPLDIIPRDLLIEDDVFSLI